MSLINNLGYLHSWETEASKADDCIHRWAEGFRQSWVLSFDPSYLGHAPSLMTKMMALNTVLNSARF